MTTFSKIDKYGRVTLPSPLRKALTLKPGDHVVFDVRSDGTAILRVKRWRLNELAGILTRPDQPAVSIEEMRR